MPIQGLVQHFNDSIIGMSLSKLLWSLFIIVIYIHGCSGCYQCISCMEVTLISRLV